MMKTIAAVLALLATTNASPTPQPELPSFFTDPTLPVLDKLDGHLINLTGGAAPHARDTSSLSPRALQLNYLLCNVVFDGQNQGNSQPFRVAGQLLVTGGIPTPGTGNGANPVEVVVAIGNPASNPVAGAFRYTTNRYLNRFVGGARDNSRLDFAFVTASANAVGVTVSPGIAAANTLSVFNVRTGFITAEVYNPSSGQLNLVFGAGGTVQGGVAMMGRGLISGSQGHYKAAIIGSGCQKGTTVV